MTDASALTDTTPEISVDDASSVDVDARDAPDASIDAETTVVADGATDVVDASDSVGEAPPPDAPVDAADVTAGLWSFDGDIVNGSPDGFTTALGLWLVQSEPTAPSPSHVLRQLNALTDTDYPRIFVTHATLGDGTVRVRCRPEDGAIDRACGLAFRAIDDDDYYVARANALENNVNLYVVVAGNRALIATASASVTSGDWHQLEVSVSGSRIAVRWDGAGVIATSDATYASGRIGLWTKADSITAFDDLELIP
jgi:hypothetical protein